MRLRLCLALLLVLLVGCGGKPYAVAPVSGRVTLDGKPLAKASVTFAPMAEPGKHDPGPTSLGLTDTDGRFKLTINPTTPGAVVGKSRIYISTLLTDGTGGGEQPDAGVPIKAVERVPARYNMKTELTFDVPAAGSDKADFPLKSR